MRKRMLAKFLGIPAVVGIAVALLTVPEPANSAVSGCWLQANGTCYCSWINACPGGGVKCNGSSGTACEEEAPN
jgi:hypothetical protein